MTFEPSLSKPPFAPRANHVQTNGLDRDRLHAFSFSSCPFFQLQSSSFVVDSFVSVCGRRASEVCVCQVCHFAHFASRSAFSRSLFGLAAELLPCSILVQLFVIYLALSVVANCQSALLFIVVTRDHYFPASACIFLPLPYKSPSICRTLLGASIWQMKHAPLSLQPPETSVPMTDGFITVADSASNP